MFRPIGRTTFNNSWNGNSARPHRWSGYRAGAGGKATDEEVELEEEDSAPRRVGAVEAATPEVAANPAGKITDRLSASARAEYTARIVSRSAHPPWAWMTSPGILAVLRALEWHPRGSWWGCVGGWFLFVCVCVVF